jgi:hypothetical protein
MDISYKNNIGGEISEKEAISSGNYDKIYASADGLKKKNEHYNNNKLARIDYYRDDAESEEDVMNLLLSFGINFSIYTIQNNGNYIIEKHNTYYGNQLFRRWRSLYDTNNQIICIEEVDLETNQPLPQYTVKYLGNNADEPIDGGYCSFHYNGDGTVWYCEYHLYDLTNDHGGENFEGERLQLIKDMYNLSNDAYNYFLTADLLPPIYLQK